MQKAWGAGSKEAIVLRYDGGRCQSLPLDARNSYLLETLDIKFTTKKWKYLLAREIKISGTCKRKRNDKDMGDSDAHCDQEMVTVSAHGQPQQQNVESQTQARGPTQTETQAATETQLVHQRPLPLATHTMKKMEVIDGSMQNNVEANQRPRRSLRARRGGQQQRSACAQQVPLLTPPPYMSLLVFVSMPQGLLVVFHCMVNAVCMCGA